MDISTTKILVSIPTAFLPVIDRAAIGEGVNRSAFVRMALMQKLGVQNMVEAITDRGVTTKQLTREEQLLRKKAICRLAVRLRDFENYDDQWREELIKMEIKGIDQVK